MNRRNALKSFLTAIGFSVISAAPQIAYATQALVIWAKENTLGYKKKATKDKVAQGKICLSCSWYKDDAKHEYGGECALKGMQSAMKTSKVMVHSAGVCNMWQKKS